MPPEGSPATPSVDDLLGHAGWIRGLARSLVRDDATADDMVQDVWTQALRTPPDDRDSPRPWLATVLRNLVRDRERSGGRRRRREEVAARPEGLPDTATVVARAETHRRLVEAVMALPEPYRETVLLRYFEELPPREVAPRMGVPVETVRTRTRRALERLRERLDEREGGRDRWRAALLPLATGPLTDTSPATAPATDTASGGRPMSLKVAAAVALLVAVPTAVHLIEGAAPPRDDAAQVGLDDLVALDDEPAVDPRRSRGGRRDADPPTDDPPAPEREEVDRSEDLDVDPLRDDDPLRDNDQVHAEEELWEVPAEVFADGELSISVAVEPDVPVAGEAFHVVTTFRNTGTGPVRFHVDEFAGAVPFPRIEFRDAEGQPYRVVPMSFQSMWKTGLQGTVVRLEPGEIHHVKSRVDELAPLEAGVPYDDARFAATQKRHPIQPGTYAVSVRLVQDEPTVPWGKQNFRSELRELPGLWTGDVSAEPVSVRIVPPREPRLILTVPDTLRVGEQPTATLLLENPGDTEVALPGPFVVRRSEKGGPPLAAWVAFEGDGVRPAEPTTDTSITLAPREKRRVEIRLDRLDWQVRSRAGHPAWRATWPHVREYGMFSVAAGRNEDSSAPAHTSNSEEYVAEPAPELDAVHLELDATRLFDPSPTVTLRLRNQGAGELVLPTDVVGHLAFHLRGDVGTRTPPHLVSGADTGPIRIRPGEMWAREVAVAPDWRDDRTPAGRYTLTGSWANADPGPDGNFTLGRIVAEPASLDLPE